MRRTDTSNQLNSVVTQNHRDDYCVCVYASVDGNQTTVKTSTGIWNVEYNGENRPIRFAQGNTIVTMDYDYMGRRFIKTSQGTIQKFVYSGYLQIEELNVDNETTKSYIWDPTESIATRPLAMTYNSTNYYYTHDANKNITEVVSDNGESVHYEYSPFGAVTTSTGTLATTNPFRFSSEYYDADLGLIYYNYRHYNPTDGRWLSRDPIQEKGGLNLYGFVDNRVPIAVDGLGLFLQSFFECRENLKIFRADFKNPNSELSKFWDNLDKGNKKCPLPAIGCACHCLFGDGLYSLLGITICAGYPRADMEVILKHELVHAAQDCRGNALITASCEEAINNEMEAYVKQGGLFSCAAIKKDPDMVGHLLKSVLKSSSRHCFYTSTAEERRRYLMNALTKECP